MNPLRVLLCVVMLLEYLEQLAAAERLNSAINECLSQGLLASRSTAEVIDAVCAKL